MANGFATGVSSTPLDIASAGQIFMRSAVETRLAEIEANKLEVSENVEKALKAMSISTIEGLSQNMRVRYQKEIEKYRDNVRNKLISNQGKLSLDDEREIQDGFVDLQKRQAADVFQLKQLAKAQDMIVANYDSYDPRVVDELRQAEEALDRGEFIGDPLAMVVKNRVPASVGDIVSKFYGNELKSLEQYAVGGFSGNVFKQTELVGIDPKTQALTEKAVNLRDRLLEDPRIKYRYTNPDGSLNPEAYAREKQAVEDNITRILEEMKPYRQSTGDSGFYKGATNYDLQDVSFGDQEFLMVGTPGDVATPEKPTIIGEESGAINTTTGKPISGRQPIRIMGVGYDKKTGEPVILAQGEGGYVMKDGKVGYEALDTAGGIGTRTSIDSEEAANKKLATVDDLKDISKMQPAVESTLRREKGNRNIVVDNVSLNPMREEGDIIVVSGTVDYRTRDSKRDKFKKRETFTYRFRKKKDVGAESIFKLPYERHKPLLAGWRKKALVEGKDVMNLQPIDVGETKGETGRGEGNEKPVLSVSKYNEAKGKNYTKAQVQARFGDQYKIVD
jgi:hypothetical protein